MAATDAKASLGQPSFMQYMNLLDPKTGEPTAEGNRLIGSFSGVFQAGAFFGVIIASWVMDRFGRKAGVAYCSFFSLFGGAWLTGSTNATMVRETDRGEMLLQIELTCCDTVHGCQVLRRHGELGLLSRQ